MTMRSLVRRLWLLALVLALAGPDASAQTAATKRVMREKLSHSQKVLEAILTSDFKGLDSHSSQLADLTKTEGWAVLKSAEYQLQSQKFVRALEALRESARTKDLDAAANQYMAMALACFDCHRSVKNSRLAAR